MIDMNEVHDVDLKNSGLEMNDDTNLSDLDMICTETFCGPLTSPECHLC